MSILYLWNLLISLYGIHKGGSAHANVGNRMTTELFNLIVNVSKM